jgi:hypothetical protein
MELLRARSLIVHQYHHGLASLLWVAVFVAMYYKGSSTLKWSILDNQNLVVKKTVYLVNPCLHTPTG